MNLKYKLASIAVAYMGAALRPNVDPFVFTSYPVPNIKFPDKANKLFGEPHREMKKFSIQGNKVMAFSKKDAITRLKAMGKLKRK